MYIVTTHDLLVTSIEFRVRRRTGRETGERKRNGHPSQEKIYVTAHARMTECVLSVCVHPDVHVWSRGFGHLPVGRDPLCVHERRGNERAEKKSFAGHEERDGGKIKRDGPGILR